MAVLNLAQFNTSLMKAASKIDGEILDFIKTVAAEVFRRIVMRNPVDTGRSRGNWQIEFNSSAIGIIPDERKNEWNAVLLRGLSRLDKIKLQDITKNLNSIHITNNVNYISYLEDGRSKQAPNGFVALSLHEIEIFLRKI